MLLNKVDLVTSLYMVNLENPENQNLNAHFNLRLLKQCYHEVIRQSYR